MKKDHQGFRRQVIIGVVGRLNADFCVLPPGCVIGYCTAEDVCVLDRI